MGVVGCGALMAGVRDGLEMVKGVFFLVNFLDLLHVSLCLRCKGHPGTRVGCQYVKRKRERSIMVSFHFEIPVIRFLIRDHRYVHENFADFVP